MRSSILLRIQSLRDLPLQRIGLINELFWPHGLQLLLVCEKLSRCHDRKWKGKRRNGEYIFIATYHAIGVSGQTAFENHVFRVPADFKFFAGDHDCCGGDDGGDSSDENFKLLGVDFSGS